MPGPGSRIREIRKRQNKSQKEAAAALRVHQSTWSDWENGEIDLTYGNLERIAKFLRVGVEELVAQPPPRKSRVCAATR